MAAYVAIAISILLTLGAMILCALHVSEPISGLTRTMGVLASGDVAQEVPYRMRRDEIGAMARAVQVFKHNPIRTGPLEGETVETRFAIEEQRKTCRRQMAGTFEGAVGGIVGMVSSAATELQATARTMTATATETASQSTTVAAAAGEAAVNVGTVAAAAEQLGASVQEIGRQVQGSASLAQEAVGEATQTAALVEQLSQAAERIGDVVGMISTIAGQTNLLALNATIEAARAGEAGRGFAVVAVEVKALASHTAKATDEITGQIARIPGATGQTVTAIEGIRRCIEEISGVSTSIAAEEQGRRRRRSCTTSPGGYRHERGDRQHRGVAQAFEGTGVAASQVLTSASELSRQAEHLGA